MVPRELHRVSTAKGAKLEPFVVVGCSEAKPVPLMLMWTRNSGKLHIYLFQDISVF